MFTPDELKKVVSDNLNTDITIPDGHRGALVTVADGEKVLVVAGFKIKDNWEVEIMGKHDWHGDNQVGVVSKLTW